MGGMLSQPKTDKETQEGNGLGLRYGLSSMQGWRSEMEDAHDVRIGLKYGLEDWSYFAVFDGHAGKRAAAFAAWNLLEFILRDNKFELDTNNLPEYVYIEPDLTKLNHRIPPIQANNIVEPLTVEESLKALSDAESSHPDTKQDNQRDTESTCPKQNFRTTLPLDSLSPPPTDSTKVDDQDKDKANQPKIPVPNLSGFAKLPVLQQLSLVESAIKSGFLKTDQSMRQPPRDMSGCTAICTLVSPTHLFIANCGDSRAVLFDGEKAKFATEDHKPLNPKERRRIINAGGSATQRINGTLAVSRALGDFDFKSNDQKGPCEQMVSPEPEVTVIERHPHDQFLVLACDGIWDVMRNEQLCEFIAYKLKIEPSMKNVCSSVLDVCLHRGSRDNMSIIIVVFENGPKFEEKERQFDSQNDEYITEAIIQVGEKQEDFSEFFYTLKEYRIEDIRQLVEKKGGYLPPGACLDAKYDLIRDLYAKEFESDSYPEIKEYDHD